jgi:ubiquinone/menaquinone biosynthesis C-methylase UbiE
MMASVPGFDDLAELYDETRGGEPRGDEYAADVAAHLPAADGPILEVGVGTGVVALGLVKRGHRVIGLDVSEPMLSKAKDRLGPVVVLGDAREIPLGTASVAHAVSVWVLQTVAGPERLLAEVARVLQPGGRYVVCTTQRPAADSVLGQIIDRMGDAVDARRPRTEAEEACRRRVTAGQILEWASAARFAGTVHPCERAFVTRPSQELDKIDRRAWPALRQLGEEALRESTAPAVVALQALPERDYVCRVTSELVVLERGPAG